MTVSPSVFHESATVPYRFLTCWDFYHELVRSRQTCLFG
jgi:hypothetical protein